MILTNGDVQGVIFDIDGTLLDSMGFIGTVTEKYLAQFGKISDSQFYKKLGKMTFPEGIHFIKSYFNVETSEQEMLAGFYDLLGAFYRNDVALIPGAKKLIEELHEAEIPMICATAGHTEFARSAFIRLGIAEYFTDILSCEDLNMSKSEPHIFYKSMERLLNTSLTDEEAAEIAPYFLIFEDNDAALKTASDAGFLTCRVRGKIDFAENSVKQDLLEIINDKQLN